MTQRSPEAVFAEAGAAMERKDWEAFFACLDRRDLIRIASNSINTLMNVGEERVTALSGVSANHGYPLDELQMRSRRIVESARSLMAGQGADQEPASGQQMMLERSLQHRTLVKNYENALKRGFKAVASLAEFTAALERLMREGGGGGSVSSKLFVGETLQDLVQGGKTARAVRKIGADREEKIEFVQKKGTWYIRLPEVRG